MKEYYIYIGLLIISLLGTDLTDFSLAIWVLDQQEATVSSYSLIWFFEAIPAVLLSIFIGSLVDRWDKKKMMIYGQLFAGLGSVILFILYSMNLLVPWHIMLVSGIGSISSLFVFQAFYVATKSMVAKSELLKAQALVSLCYGVVEMGVPIIAPVLYKLLGIKTIFLLDIVTFSIPIVGFILLAPIITKKTIDKLNIRNDLKVVRNFITSQKGTLQILMFYFLGSFLMGLLTLLLTPLLLDISNEYVLGLVYSFIGLGTVVGSLIASKMKHIRKPNRISIILYGIIGLIIMCFIFGSNVYTIAIAGMMILSILTIVGILYNSFVQIIVPEEILGRFSGMMGLFVGIAGPLSFLLSGFVVDVLSAIFKGVSYVAYYPGSEVAFSILILFAFAGLFLFILSLLFKDHKDIKALDLTYARELKTSLNEKLYQ